MDALRRLVIGVTSTIAVATLAACEPLPPPEEGSVLAGCAGPDGGPPATTPDLTFPVLGELPPCSA